MAGRVADGVMLSDVPLARMAEVLPQLAAGRELAGRAGEPIFVTNFFAWHIKQDRTEAVAEARMELIWRGLLQPWHTSPFLGDDDAAFVDSQRDAFLQAFLTRSSAIEGVPERIIAALVDNLTFTGGPEDIDTIATKLKALEVAGQDAVTLKVHGDAIEAVHMIGQHLLPALH
jgi:alkanesulfonate monooxygenase SsuD/methylene tetrahydromethanopterin reductase-like flavin-dependent oxidoreductase (luciferase family)